MKIIMEKAVWRVSVPVERGFESAVRDRHAFDG